jgi:hypothetical protein
MHAQGASWRGSDSGSTYNPKPRCPHGSTRPRTCRQCQLAQAEPTYRAICEDCGIDTVLGGAAADAFLTEHGDAKHLISVTPEEAR